MDVEFRSRDGWLFGLVLTGLLFACAAHAASWWDCAWRFRTELAVSSTATATDYTVRVQLDAGDFDPAYVFTISGDDVRVIDGDDTSELEFVVEEWDAAARAATVSIRVPMLSTTARTVYIYYGNTLPSGASAVPPASDFASAFSETGWRLHTRNTAVDPTNQAQARAVFESAMDSTTGYGCAQVPSLIGRNNRNTFGGPATNFALYNEVWFEADIAGNWGFRYGADYGRGGGLYVNDQTLEEEWNTDLWWAGNWNNPDTLSGTINLGVGYHYLETLGFEGCCDGGIHIQFRRPGSSTWLDMVSGNITLAGRSCPTGTPTTAAVDTDSPAYFSGTVFIDNGVGGTAHDGLLAGGETGVPAIDVTTTIVGTGSAQIDQSDADGNWSVCFLDEANGQQIDVLATIPDIFYTVSEGIAAINTAPEPDAQLRFVAAAGTSYNAIDIGVIEKPQLVSDQAIDVAAGASGLLAHRYTASSSATLSFQIAEIEHNAAGSYSYTAYYDSDCNGAMDTTPVLLATTYTVAAGESVCMLVEVTGESIVREDSLLSLRVDALSRFTGIALEDSRFNLDQVNGVKPADLLLQKEVCNVSQSSCDLVAGTGFGINNQASPEEELVYRVTFSSPQISVNELRIVDAVPTFTTLKPSSLAVVQTPSGVSCAVVQPADQNASGYTGTLEWQCNGTLAPTEIGVLGFSVLVE